MGIEKLLISIRRICELLMRNWINASSSAFGFYWENL